MRKPWLTDKKYWTWSNQTNKYTPQKTRWRAIRRLHWVNKYAHSIGCKQCEKVGITHKWNPAALQFDHNETDNKLFAIKDTSSDNLGLRAGRPAIMVLTDEIRKCTVKCANHHSMDTRENNQSGRKRQDEQV